jgi:hypothetical protein
MANKKPVPKRDGLTITRGTTLVSFVYTKSTLQSANTLSPLVTGGSPGQVYSPSSWT